MAKVHSTSFNQLSYIPETVAGETPTVGKGINLRCTGESLNMEVSKETSKELNSTRQTASMFLTDAQTAGDTNFELSVREYDPFFEAALMGTWAGTPIDGINAGGVTFDKGAKTITLTNASTLAAGDYFTITGTGLKPENRGPFVVKTIDGAKKVITVDAMLEDQTLTKGQLFSGKLENGTTQRSFSIENAFTSANKSLLYKGMQVDKFNISFEPSSAVTGSFSYIGTVMEDGEGNMLGDKTDYTPSQTGSIINTVNGVKEVLFNGKTVEESVGSGGVGKISLEFSNNLKGVKSLGVLGNSDVIAGTIACSGSLELHFNDFKVVKEVLKQTRFRVEFPVYDQDGHGYAFVLPSVELSSPKTNAGSQDEVVETEIEFTALMHPELRKTIQMYRF
nr:MAG TPA: Tail tube protein [Caudoviricetes sp.]